jgi:Fibronectin type III-like domain
MGCDPEPDLNIGRGRQLAPRGIPPYCGTPFPSDRELSKSLQPGETKTVKLPLATNSLAYFDEAKGKFVVREEPVTLRIGSSSADIRLEQKMAVTGAK